MQKMNPRARLYPLICICLNFIIASVLYRFNIICITNYDSMGFALPGLTVWALRLPYFYFLFAFIGTGLLVLSLIRKISNKHLVRICFGILVTDIGFLLVSAIGYSLPFLHFPVVFD